MTLRDLCACGVALASVLLLACGDDNATSEPMHEMHDADDMMNDADQTPPMGAAAVMAWLQTGAYNDWSCEPEVHEAREPSPHGWNRICSNDAIAEHTEGDADWPKGAAAVKELYASADGEEPVGYAVYLKTDDDSAGGDNWYWYEIVPDDSMAPHDDDGIVADGMGDDGAAKDICVSCHAGAGSDALHTPTMGGRDQVYTPVPAE